MADQLFNDRPESDRAAASSGSQATAFAHEQASSSSPQPVTSFQEDKPRSTRKLADHPHWWTLALGLVAVVISSLSYRESWEARHLAEAVNRPLVRVVDVGIGSPALGATEITGPRYANSYRLSVKNSGKSFANDVRLHYKAQLEDSRCCRGYLMFSDVPNSTFDDTQIGDLAPDEEYEAPLWAYVLKKNPTIPVGDHEVNIVSLFIVGQISYVNPFNKEKFQEPFCFMDPGTTGHFQRCSAKEPTYR